MTDTTDTTETTDISVKDKPIDKPIDPPIDLWHKITNIFDHERGKILGALVGISIAFIPMACESTTINPFDDASSPLVTRSELTIVATKERKEISYLQAELEGRIASYNEMIETSEADLDAKDAKKQELLNFVGGALGTVGTESFNPLSLITSAATFGLAGLFGGHTLVDSRRKNKLIEAKK